VDAAAVTFSVLSIAQVAPDLIPEATRGALSNKRDAKEFEEEEDDILKEEKRKEKRKRKKIEKAEKATRKKRIG